MNCKIPIVVGGSHLYIDALIKNYDLSSFDERDDKFENLSTPELFEKFKLIDEAKAQTMINNRQRLIRALQIYTHARSSIPPMTKKNKQLYDSLIIFCNEKRELIYEKTNKRVDEMINKG
jgi:tRNA dimethylallyltransferase